MIESVTEIIATLHKFLFENGGIIIWDYFLVSMFMRQKRYIFVSIYLSYKNTSIFSTASKIKFFVHLHFERYPYLINQLPKQSIDLWTGKLVKWTMIIAIIDPYTITTHCSLCWNLRSLSQRRK